MIQYGMFLRRGKTSCSIVTFARPIVTSLFLTLAHAHGITMSYYQVDYDMEGSDMSGKQAIRQRRKAAIAKDAREKARKALERAVEAVQEASLDEVDLPRYRPGSKGEAKATRRKAEKLPTASREEARAWEVGHKLQNRPFVIEEEKPATNPRRRTRDDGFRRM